MSATCADDDTLPPLVDGKAPESLDETWATYDPRAEPLEVRVVKEWEEDGVVCRIVSYRVGVFKGVVARMGAIYAFPKEKGPSPGLVQIHGGGQSANLNAATTNALRGYACVSINWGGNPLKDANYGNLGDSPVTDWGAVDATHPPQRDPVNHFHSLEPSAFTIDPVESPRNSAWLLVAIGARRALTFLENQPEVDGSKLGVYGHSMGGKLTVMTAALDRRVVAAAPSCGGISDFPSEPKTQNSLFTRRLACPTMFLVPVNDFYGRVDDLPGAAPQLPAESIRFVCAGNQNHRDSPEGFVCGPLWFDQHLKGKFAFPKTPQATLSFESADGVPRLTVTVDDERPPRHIDVYYTQAAIEVPGDNPHWRHVVPTKHAGSWTAPLPLATTDRPLRVLANVTWPLDAPVVGAGYYYSKYAAEAFTLSSKLIVVPPEELKANHARTENSPSPDIEDFADGWRRGWFVHNENGQWPFRTNKLQDPKWQAPSPEAKLVLEVRSVEANKLVVEIDAHATERDLPAGEWSTLSFAPGDFTDATGAPMPSWEKLKELALGPATTLRKEDRTRTLGGVWKGPLPEFRRLRWE